MEVGAVGEVHRARGGHARSAARRHGSAGPLRFHWVAPFVGAYLGAWMVRRMWGPGLIAGADSTAIAARTDRTIRDVLAHGHLNGWSPYFSIGHDAFLINPPGFTVIIAAYSRGCRSASCRPPARSRSRCCCRSSPADCRCVVCEVARRRPSGCLAERDLVGHGLAVRRVRHPWRLRDRSVSVPGRGAIFLLRARGDREGGLRAVDATGHDRRAVDRGTGADAHPDGHRARVLRRDARWSSCISAAGRHSGCNRAATVVGAASGRPRCARCGCFRSFSIAISRGPPRRGSPPTFHEQIADVVKGRRLYDTALAVWSSSGGSSSWWWRSGRGAGSSRARSRLVRSSRSTWYGACIPGDVTSQMPWRAMTSIGVIALIPAATMIASLTDWFSGLLAARRPPLPSIAVDRSPSAPRRRSARHCGVHGVRLRHRRSIESAGELTEPIPEMRETAQPAPLVPVRAGSPSRRISRRRSGASASSHPDDGWRGRRVATSSTSSIPS